MKKLLTFLFILTAFTSSAQIYQNDPSYGRSIDRYEVRKDLGIPTFCGVPTVNSTVTNKAKIAYDSCGGLFYIFNPATQIWSTISASAVVQDGLISGGTVSWSGAGLTFDIQAAVFRIFGTTYYTNDTTITLDPADPTYSRIDLFALDTSNGGEVVKITGTPSPTPVAPQTQDFQIALTTGITLNVGDTVPSNVSIHKIYDENIEWATSTDRATVDFNNTVFPYSGSKDAFVSSYANIGRLVFTRSGNGVIDGSEVLRFRISLNSPLRTKHLSIGFFHGPGSILSSNIISIGSNNGLDPNKVNQYQSIAIPISYFQFTDNSYNRIILYISDYDTSFVVPFYLDDMQLQSGVNNIPQQTDFSKKVDSVVTRNDSLFYVINKNYYWTGYKGSGSGVDSTALYSVNQAIDSSSFGLSDLKGNKHNVVILADGFTDGTGIQSIQAGTNVTVDNTDPLNPIVSAAGGGSYTLPTASSTILGGIKVGSGLSIDGSGVLSATGGSGGIGDSIISYTKNSTRDSSILLLRDGRRFAVKDSLNNGSVYPLEDVTAAGATSSRNLAIRNVAVGTGGAGFPENTTILFCNNCMPIGTGNFNLLFGNDLMKANTSGHNNILFSSYALQHGTTASYNTVFGIGGGGINTGTYNSVFGQGSLTFLSDGISNVAVGSRTMTTLTHGSKNTALGDSSMFALTDYDSLNTFLGFGSGRNITGVHNSTSVGAHAEPTQSNQVVLGDTNVTQVLTYGNILSKVAIKSSDPTTTDIPTGFTAIYKNSTTGLTYLWANNSGTLIKVQLQ